MTEQQIKLARHALGLDGRKKVSYRNRFVTRDDPDWDAMVAARDATKRDGSTIPFGGDHIYYLTEQGARKALKRGEKLDPEDFPSK